MNAEALTRALAGRWSGSSGSAKCPAHPDKTPSLSIRDGDNGRLLTCCHAGCPPAAVWGALQDRGLVERADHRPARRGRPQRPQRPWPVSEPSPNQDHALKIWRASRDTIGTVTATYLHHRGITIATPATIRDHPGLKHGPTGLNLPAMVAAITGADRKLIAIQRTFLRCDGRGKANVSQPKLSLGTMRDGAVRLGPAGPVLGIAEGVETGLSAAQLFDLPVWCSLSASRLDRLWLPPEAREVHVFADNGIAGPRGRRARRQGVPGPRAPGRGAVPAGEVRGLQRPLVRGGGGMTETRTLPELQPEDFDQYDGEVIEPQRRFPLTRFDQIQLSTAPSYLVKGLIPRSGLVVIWGPPKCGKSFWAFDVAAHIALGWAYRDRKVRQGTVVYLVLEGEHGIGARVEAFRRHHLAKNAGPIPLYLLPTRLDLINEYQTLIDEIGAQTRDNPPALIVIDTLNRSLSGSESRDEDMGAYIKAADAVREAFKCAVALVHHCGIEATRPRGHTSLTGAADAQIAIKRDPAGVICTTLEWMKDGPEGVEVYSKLEPVEVGVDDDGDVISSCIIIEAERAKTDTSRKLTQNQATMRGVLDDFGSSGATIEDWNAAARQEGLGVKRKADLHDFRKALKDKRFVHTTNDRWYVTKL